MSGFFNTPSALVRLYQHWRQCLSKFISPYSKTVSLCQTFSVPSVLISNCLSLSVRTAQWVSLCQTFAVTSAQYQYLSKFVSEKGESQYFSDLVVKRNEKKRFRFLFSFVFLLHRTLTLLVDHWNAYIYPLNKTIIFSLQET